jgi:hypothetical protein
MLGAQFVLAIGSTNASVYTLGGTFFRNFYTELDLSNEQITLATSIYAGQGTSIIKHRPTFKIAGIAWYWWLIFLLVGLSFCLLILYAVRILCVKLVSRA